MVTNQTTRALVLSGCLLASAVYLARATSYEEIPIRVPLAGAAHAGRRVAGRARRRPRQGSAGGARRGRLHQPGLSRRRGRALGLYIGYYKSQREGESIHSPLNCLPGSGWLPMSSGRMAIPVQAAADSQSTGPSSTIEVNRYLVQKGGETMLVLYWYQSHGRVIASEYWGKIYMVLDAVRINQNRRGAGSGHRSGDQYRRRL